MTRACATACVKDLVKAQMSCFAATAVAKAPEGVGGMPLRYDAPSTETVMHSYEAAARAWEVAVWEVEDCEHHAQHGASGMPLSRSSAAGPLVLIQH